MSLLFWFCAVPLYPTNPTGLSFATSLLHEANLFPKLIWPCFLFLLNILANLTLLQVLGVSSGIDWPGRHNWLRRPLDSYVCVRSKVIPSVELLHTSTMSSICIINIKVTICTLTSDNYTSINIRKTSTKINAMFFYSGRVYGMLELLLHRIQLSAKQRR